MPEKINWTTDVQIVGGPRIVVSQTVNVDAYDKIDVVVAEGTDENEVQVQPGGPGQVQFILIKSSKYDAALTYSVNAPEASSVDRIKLDALQVLIGEGAVGLLGASPQTLYFYNHMGQDVTIQIIVGRKATTP